MATINLKGLKPHKVSRDLSGYITYIYGPGGAGKTTFGSQMPSPLLLAFERGYNALPGVIAQDITSWAEMKQVLRQLDDPEVKENFKSVVIDTVDIASQLCEKYVCSQLDIENIGDGGWTKNGWAKVKKEWETTFRNIAMKGYAVVFISHSKERTVTNKDQTQYNAIGPSCSNVYNEIIKNMVDIEGYIDVDKGERKLVLRSDDGTIECKSRFSCIDKIIPFSYQSLVDALNKAIDEEANNTGNKFVTEEKEKIAVAATYDFDSLMAEFKEMATTLMNKSQDYQPKITAIIEKHLGKGKKIGDATIAQAEVIAVINGEIKDTLL